jgi:hypothetical protein
MIETISPEQGRMRDAATAAAAANYRPTFRTLPAPVKPDPELIKGIGFSTNAGAFRGSSPDLQSLLDALLSNFGHEQDLVEGEAQDLETNSAIRENNDGSREAVNSVRSSARQGEETVQLDRELEDQRNKSRERTSLQDTDTERLHGTLESRLGRVESELGQAESLSTRAADAVGHSTPEGASRTDQQKRRRSAEIFEQKAAASESAARLHRIMIQKVLQKAQSRLEQEREDRRVSPTLTQLENDPEFAARLLEMNKILRQIR